MCSILYFMVGQPSDSPTNQELSTRGKLSTSRFIATQTRCYHDQSMNRDAQDGLPRAWTTTGYVVFAVSAIFVGRIVYEETILTWKNGPQMVGFALAHGAAPLILVAGLVGLPCGLLWMLVSLPLLFRRKFRVPVFDWLPMALLSFLVVTLSIPYETWEELLVRTVGSPAHGGAFLVQAAAQDKLRFVKLLLREGYDINFETGGTTPLSGASNGGHEEMIKFLISKGADPNRKNGVSGESAFMSAAEMGQLGAVKVLLSSGAAPCATDKEGHTAEGLARKYHHTDIADYLASNFHCKETVAAPPCVDSAFSVCVH